MQRGQGQNQPDSHGDHQLNQGKAPVSCVHCATSSTKHLLSSDVRISLLVVQSLGSCSSQLTITQSISVLNVHSSAMMRPPGSWLAAIQARSAISNSAISSLEQRLA